MFEAASVRRSAWQSQGAGAAPWAQDVPRETSLPGTSETDNRKEPSSFYKVV